MTRSLRRLLLAYALAMAVARVTVAAPETCGDDDPAALRTAAAGAADWIVRLQDVDGSYVYEQSEDGRDLGGYNEVRHAGVTTALYQAAAAFDDDGLARAADRGLAWMRARLDGRDGWRTLTIGSYASLGAGALMLTSLEERRVLTGDTRHDGLMRDLGRFLVTLQRPDGGFHVSIDTGSGEPDTEGTSPYYPGEAYWALARLDGLFPGEGWDAPAARAAAFIARRRDDVEGVRFPPLNDHWASYGFAETAARHRLPDPEADYARRVYGRFHLLVRNEAQQESGGLFGLTHGTGRRAAALGTWVEGQAALARLAVRDDRLADLRRGVVDSAACGAGILVRRQAGAGSGDARGAWFTGGVTRMDDQQHAISGLLATADALEALDEDRP